MLIGIILAASTGVIGASVTLLGVMALPAMMAQNYSKPIATGTIASAGTLGILIPPSIMLVIMSDQLAISLGDLFMGALFPGLILGGLYITFIVIYGLIKPDAMPAPEKTEELGWPVVKEVLKAVVPPMMLILLVLGSIFGGIATPTEASGLGALGATLLALGNRRLNMKVLREVSRSTLNTSGYIVGIFLAANFFAFILRRYGGDEIIEGLVLSVFDDPYMIILFILFIIFLLGFLVGLDRDHDHHHAIDAADYSGLRHRSGYTRLQPGGRACGDVVCDLGGGDLANVLLDAAGGLCAVLPQGRVSSGRHDRPHLQRRHPICVAATPWIAHRLRISGACDVAALCSLWKLDAHA